MDDLEEIPDQAVRSLRICALESDRRVPQNERVQPVRIQLKHPVVKFFRSFCPFGSALKVSDVLSSLFYDPWVVISSRALVSTDDSLGVE